MATRPWYLDTSTAPRCPHLCDVCGEINFEWLLSNPVEVTLFRQYVPGAALQHGNNRAKPPSCRKVTENLPELALGFLTDILRKAEQCNFCRLITLTIAAGYETRTQDLQHISYDGHASPDIYITLWNSRKIEAQIAGSDAHVYEIEILLRDFQGVSVQFSAFKVLPVHRLSESEVPFEGARVGQLLDFARIRKWIGRYPSGKAVAGFTQEPLREFRVIDVQQRSVVLVRGPAGCRYLALSYVWGGDQAFKNLKARDLLLRKPGSLAPSKLPRTIADAMEFTAAIGERYVWVDSLCIVQDDERKIDLINAMDRIYGCAVATIIAAYGTNADAGLPGQRADHPKRWTQHVVEVRGMQLANRQIFLPGYGPRVWQERGWTYQEECLSLRKIHLGRDGCFLASEDGWTAEDVHAPLHKEPGPELTLANFGIPGLSQQGTAFLNTELYGMSVMFYSIKKLTFQSDALHAFAGLANIMRAYFRRPFLFGLPTSELEYALLWYPQSSTLERRLDDDTKKPLFPSWSWAAWKGAVCFGSLQPRQFSRVVWVDADAGTGFTTDQWRGGSERRDQQQHSDWEVHDRGDDKAPGYRDKSNPLVLFAHPVSANTTSRHFTKPESWKLSFIAYTASLMARPGREKAPSTIALDPEMVSYTLFDEHNSSCGVVYIHDDNSKDGSSPRKYELVAISRTADAEGRDRPAQPPPEGDEDVLEIKQDYVRRRSIRNDRSAASYMVMHTITELSWRMYDVLVIQREGGDGEAQRIGVGVCDVEAFWYAGPRMQKITLV